MHTGLSTYAHVFKGYLTSILKYRRLRALTIGDPMQDAGDNVRVGSLALIASETCSKNN
jgi:hypothetical protein